VEHFCHKNHLDPVPPAGNFTVEGYADGDTTCSTTKHAQKSPKTASTAGVCGTFNGTYEKYTCVDGTKCGAPDQVTGDYKYTQKLTFANLTAASYTGNTQKVYEW